MADLYRRNYVPAFGSWNWDDDLHFPHCFDSSAQAGVLRYTYSGDRDLYVAGDLYENHVVTPAMIVVPRSRLQAKREREVKEGKQERWVRNFEGQPWPTVSLPRTRAKPVDEDLYKISPSLLRSKPRKKRGFRFLRSCWLPGV